MIKNIITLFAILIFSINISFAQTVRNQAESSRDIEITRQSTSRFVSETDCLGHEDFPYLSETNRAPYARSSSFLLEAVNTAGNTFKISFGANFYPDQELFIYRSDPESRGYGRNDEWWTDENLITSGISMSFFADEIPEGKFYEYYVRNADYLQYGFIYGGNKVDFGNSWGTVLILVDGDYLPYIQQELDMTIIDFYAKGWGVELLIINSSESPLEVKDKIINKYNENNDIKSLYLIGNIPIPYSGFHAIDGHSDHVGAWPADTYYADIFPNPDYPDSYNNWTDEYVDTQEYSDYWNLEERHNNVPGDGKFDLDYISPVELWIGRVTLSNMPSFSQDEYELTRQYLMKAHNFKNGNLPFSRRAFVMDHFPNYPEGFAKSGYLQTSVVGRCSIDIGEWSDLAQISDQNAYLFANGVAGGYYQGLRTWGADTQTHEYHVTTQDYVNNEYKAVFQVFFGSYFGDFDNPDNFLRAPLCDTRYGLVTFWQGRPHIYLHKMALGFPVGHMFELMSQHSRNKYYPLYGLVGQSKKVLMGDPTLEFFYFNSSQIFFDSGRKILSWVISDDAIGYELYKIEGELIAGKKPELISSVGILRNSYPLFEIPTTTTYYMLRELRIEETKSGSYINRGMGSFVRVN